MYVTFALKITTRNSTLQAHRINTVSQLSDTHMSSDIDKAFPLHWWRIYKPSLIFITIKLFNQSFLRKPFRNKYASLRTNLTTMINLDKNLSKKYILLCWSIANEIGIVPAYNMRVRDNLHICTSHHPVPSAMLTNCFDYQLLPQKPEKLHFSYWTEQCRQQQGVQIQNVTRSKLWTMQGC